MHLSKNIILFTTALTVSTPTVLSAMDKHWYWMMSRSDSTPRETAQQNPSEQEALIPFDKQLVNSLEKSTTAERYIDEDHMSCLSFLETCLAQLKSWGEMY